MAKLGWCHFVFQFKRPEGEDPRWWIDVYVIDVLFREVLDRYGKKFHLWRFHRRAEKDDCGHQLSLMCYTTPRVFKKVNRYILKSDVLSTLKKCDLLERYRDIEKGRGIGGISDGQWNEAMQFAWPFFIEGMCRSFLVMLDMVCMSIEGKRGDLSFYGTVSDKMTVIWERQGSHAYFHHISGIFGYMPLYVKF